MSLTYIERIELLSIHPDAATRRDVRIMTADLMEKNRLYGMCKKELIQCCELALEYVREALIVHDSALGRTTTKNKLDAERMEKDIKRLESLIENAKALKP